MSAFAKMYFRPGENELIETDITLRPVTQSAIHGYVRGADGRTLAGVLVLLFETGRDSDDLKPAGRMFTDDAGQFFFGPLTPGQLYLVTVFQNACKVRELEIVV